MRCLTASVILAGCVLAGCGPAVGLGGSTSEGTSGEGTTTDIAMTSSAADSSTGQASSTGQPTTTPPPGTTTGTSGSSTGCDPSDSGEDTADLGECDPDQDGFYGQIRISRGDEDGRELEVDASCAVTSTESRDPSLTIVQVSCPSESVSLELYADPPVTLDPAFAVGETLQIRAFRDGFIDSTPPTHVAIRDTQGRLIAAYSNHLPVPKSVDPDYLDWFEPLTFSEIDLGCGATDPPEPPACGFIVDPCPSGYELRGLEFSDGVDELLVTGPSGGVLAPFDLRVRAYRVYPAPGGDCGDTPYNQASWAAFRVP